MSLLLAASFLAASALAQDNDQGVVPDEPLPARPLALPGGQPPPGAQPAPGGGPMDASHLSALRKYNQRRLAIHGETERHPGNTYVVGYGAPYWRWGGWYTSTVVHDPGYVTRSWGVYQGPQRLSVPAFLGVTGQTDRQAALEKDVKRYKNRSRAWFTAAGIGGASIVAGLVGMTMADSRDDLQLWNSVSFGGSLLTIGGLVGGSFPSAKAGRLLRYPSASLELVEAQDLVDGYNENLRQELGVSPNEAWRIETREGRGERD